MVPGDERILTHLRRGAVEYCVLAMVAEEPAYGLDIARRLTREGILLTGEGTLYPLLSRLRTAGFVETTWEESTEGPPRRYYAITPTGRETLDAFRRTWAPFRDAVDAAVDAPKRRRP
ncbi:PadR family transcriptional regulator [Terrabacter sp. GCM10028922]|uniref:PadR family transcriptional regulator n=1 Tax=Terrabacter sp. GCM10028922 TaxID=3273428 RepID=UPI003614690F